MIKLFTIALGGALGAVMRFLTTTAFGVTMPWATLVVNLIGCFLIGLLGGITQKLVLPQNAMMFIFVGFLGAFTTFSTFANENFNLWREGDLKMALLNILASNVLGILMVFMGFILSRYLIK